MYVWNCDLHADRSNYIGSIPEAYVATGGASCRRIPRHNEEIEILENAEVNADIPSFKCGSWQPQGLSSVPYDEKPNRH